MFICCSSSFFAWYAQWPMALWIHSLSSTEARQEHRQAEGVWFSRQECRHAEEYKNLLIGDWLVLCGREQAFQGPPRTSQHIAARRSSMAKKLFKDPKVLLAAELDLWPWRLQERSHGASARAPSQQGAQSGCWQRPRQLVNVGLDSCWYRISWKPFQHTCL